MSAWEPGCVAIVDWTTSRGERRLETMMRTRNSTWVGADDIYATDNKVRSVRLLAVIDPESEYEVSQLTRRFVNALGNDTYSVGIQDEAMQAALRSLLAPPKPDEPTGLGAVVEDQRGEWWVRDKTTTTVNHWKRARGEDGGRRYPYADIAAVRVLSDGVDQ